MAKKKNKDKEQTTTQKKTNAFKRLFRKYNLSKKNFDGQKKVFPGEMKKKKNSDDYTIKPIEMTTEIQKAWDYFESNATTLGDAGNDYKNRIERYKQLEYMIYNEGMMHTSAVIYTEEGITADEQGNTIGITAKKKEVEKDFYQWLKDIGFNDNILRNTSWNLTVYADDFWVNSIDLIEGVTEITPLSPFLIKDRLEFSPVKIMSTMAKEQKTAVATLGNRHKGLQDIADLLNNKKYDDYSKMYKSYLLGFIDTGGNALPPWNVTHFRRYSNHSEFAPFGRPLFIGSLARYKSFKATELLIDSARQASFPKEVYTIKASEEMTEVEIYQKVNQARQMIQNINKSSESPDEITLNEPIFSVDGYYNYDLKESRMDLKALGDLESKREDLEMSTGIPGGYLKSGDRSWGNSGQSLLQQSKIFARRVYANQSAILEQMTYLYRLHLMITNKFDGEDTQFELYMHYPVDEQNSDKMRLKSDSINLAKSILSDLGDSLGLDRGEALPTDVVQQVFSDYTFLDPDDISKWIKSLEDSRKVEESTREKVKEKIEKGYLTETLVREVYFLNKKKLGFNEGVYNQKHYYTSDGNNNKLLERNLTIYKEEINSKAKLKG